MVLLGEAQAKRRLDSKMDSLPPLCKGKKCLCLSWLLSQKDELVRTEGLLISGNISFCPKVTSKIKINSSPE